MKLKLLVLSLVAMIGMNASAQADKKYKQDIVVAQDGSGDYTSINDALEGIRAYMDYTVTVNIRNGVYKEKIVIPSWLKNVAFVGENPDSTIITYDHHANIDNMGTFRTYTLKVEGNDVTFRNLTIENNAPQLGQAVALHTEGDKLQFYNCRLLGNQDTLFTGGENARLYFEDCYIEGTTDFIFGPATAYFKDCTIHSKRDSYITAASTPGEIAVGYVFDNCKLTAAPEVKKVYLGRPWRPYAHTAFINCEMGPHIVAVGWHNWGKTDNEKTARYCEYHSTGAGASVAERAGWSRQLSDSEASELLDITKVFSHETSWIPAK